MLRNIKNHVLKVRDMVKDRANTAEIHCDVIPPLQVSNHGLRFAYQLLGGVFIIGWSFILCAILFTALWFFPVKFALVCLPW